MPNKHKMEFAGDDIIKGWHIVDLQEYGDFIADCLEVDLEHPTTIIVHGYAYWTPKHLPSQEGPATLVIDLNPYFWDEEKQCYRYPETEEELNQFSPGYLFHEVGWQSWNSYDIEEDWEF